MSKKIGALLLLAMFALAAPVFATEQIDARSAGLPPGWLAFGFLGQALFTSRMLLQWIAAERQGKSVVPPLFWWLSLAGGAIGTVYFIRRGDPVGILGQATPLVVYIRNLMLITRHRKKLAHLAERNLEFTQGDAP